jgi:rubrerythrin
VVGFLEDDKDKKVNENDDENLPKEEGSFSGDNLLSFSDAEPVKPPEPPSAESPAQPEPPPAEPVPGGLKVDDVLANRPEIEIDTSGIKSEPSSPEPAPYEPPPPEPEATKASFLEIHSPKIGEEVWKVSDTPPADASETARKRHPDVKPPAPAETIPVDHQRLRMLDNSLKEELHRLREESQAGMIPGDFLETRRKLTDEGILECPVCHIKVPDTPGKIDYCPKCGLAIDDYFGQFKRDWERKYKNVRSQGVKEFDIEKPKKGSTKWEQWKEEKGIDPEAELLVCPRCGATQYDDPFVANKCPNCNIPLDLHLQFPRDYITKREAARKGRRWEIDNGEFKNEKEKDRKK